MITRSVARPLAAFALFCCVFTPAYGARPAAPALKPVPPYSTNATLTLRGQAAPALHIFVDGEVQRAHTLTDASGSFSIEVTLAQNERNDLTLFATTDPNGLDNKSPSVRISTIHDSVLPTIEVTTDPGPNEAGWHHGPVKVKFRCSDRGSGIAACSDSVTLSAPGARQTVTGEARDKAGNRATASVTINIDTSTPQIHADTPVDATLIYASPVHIAGTVGESLSGIKAVNCGKVPASISGKHFACDVPLEPGDNNVKIWAADVAGNIGVVRKQLVLGPPLPGGDTHQMMTTAHIAGHRNVDILHTNFLSGEVSVLVGNGDGTFPPEQRVVVGSYPSALAVADVNGDAIPDIVTTHYTTHEVAIQYGRADGTFITGPRFSVDDFPSAVAIADIDGDGRPDILTAHMLNYQVHLHLAQRNGSFKEQPSFSVGDGPVALALGDVNSDGKLDIVVANFQSGDLSVLFGKGKGKFEREQRMPLAAALTAGAASATALAPSAIAIADLNSDGILDLLTSNYVGNSVTVLLGTGGGKFAPPRSFATGQQPLAVAAADVNGDGRPDVITANAGSADVSILLNQGNGVLAAPTEVAAGTAPGSLALADLNGDGRMDVITGNAEPAAHVLVGNGGGLSEVFSPNDAMSRANVYFLPLIVGPDAFNPLTPHTSLIELHNLAHQANDVTLTFVDETSGVAIAQYTGTLPAAGAVTLATIQDIPTGWIGSAPPRTFTGAVIVSAKRPLSAISSYIALSGARDRYDAVKLGEGSARIIMPNVTKNVSGFNSTFSVQNIGTQSASVFIDYTPVKSGLRARGPTVTLAPGQSHTFRVRDIVIEDDSGQFWGSAAAVSSGSEIAAVSVHEVVPPDGPRPQLRVYEGIADRRAAPLVYAPLYLINADRGFAPVAPGTRNDLWFTELDVTNIGTQPTDLVIEFSPNQSSVPIPTANAATLFPDCEPLPSVTISGLAPSGTLYIPSQFAPGRGLITCKYVGSASVRSTSGQPLAVQVLEHSAFDSAMYPAVAEADSAAEVFVPRVLSQYTSQLRYTEMHVQNVSTSATNVRIAYGPNRLLGGQAIPDTVRFLDPGQTLSFSDLGLSPGIEYYGSATISSDNGVRLAVAATELLAIRDVTLDHLEALRALPLQKTQGALKAVQVPDALIVPVIGPCLGFVEKVSRVRDGADPSGLFISPAELRPVVPILGAQNCFESDDDELNQRAFTQGIQLTRDLPTFLQFDPQPALGPVPFLLVNTRPGWGTALNNDSLAAMMTTYSTVRSRGSSADPWGPLAALAAGTAAAAALSNGAGKHLADNLRDIDWFSGPIDLSPSAPNPRDRSAQLRRSLEGTGRIAAFPDEDDEAAELAQLYKDIMEFLGLAEATTAPPPPPQPDACRDGFLAKASFGMVQDFYQFNLQFQGLPDIGVGFLDIVTLSPKQKGTIDTCKILRTVSQCMQNTRNPPLNQLIPSGPPGSIPQEVRDFLNRYWGDTHRVENGLESWLIRLNDDRGSGCL